MTHASSEYIIAGIERDGYFIEEGLFQPQEIEDLLYDLSTRAAFVYTEDHAPDHNLLTTSGAVKEIAFAACVRNVVEQVVGIGFIPLKAIILDKSASYNWGLDWHQDTRIQVQEHIETEGFSNWSEEYGIVNVVPPAEVLQTMLTVRIHLDECNELNGAILVIPGSHRHLVIPAEDIAAIKENGPVAVCACGAGAVMYMSPLILHKSPYAVADMPRRILQIEYGPGQLPGNLEWYQ